MNLIDRDAYKQELEKAINRCLRMTGRPDPVVLMTLQYAVEKLDSAPVVEAVPIEWINHYMDTELTKGSLFYSCMSEFMRDWKKEQGKAEWF